MKLTFQSSISNRLKMVLLLTSGIALLLAMVGFLVNDWFDQRKALFEHLNAQASIIGSNSVAAMAFNDPSSATETLSTLISEKNILAACLFDMQGREFAKYQRDKGSLPSVPPNESSGFVEGNAFVALPVALDNNQFGNILLISDFSDWKRRQQMNLLISAGLLFLSLFVAILFSSRLQRLISEPILKLAQTARSITEHKDYNLRAEKSTRDEIGQLVDDFNNMLQQIQLRDQELQGIQEHLEEKVHSRTRELTSQARRAEALLELPPASEQLNETDFVQRGLEFAEKLTDSKIAFLHFVDEDEGTLELVTWSHNTLHDYCQAVYDKHYLIEQAGIWADAVRQHKPVVFNDYPNYPHKKGLPEGHAELNRLISLPVIEDGKAVMLAGVGNKETEYTELDVETMQLISNEIWRILQRRHSMNKITRFNRVLEQSQNEIYIFDSETLNFFDVNLGARTNLGYSMGELRKMTPLDLNPEFTADFFEELVKPLRSDDKNMIHFTTVHRRKDGTTYPIEAHIQYMDEQPPVFVVIVLDITERKIAEVEQARLQRELQQARKMEALGQLTGGIAHDFNNILGIILGYAEFALKECDPENQAKLFEHLKQVEKAGRRAKSLVTQMLAFSRSDASDDNPLQLQAILKEDIKMLRSTLPTSIEISTEIEDDLPAVLMDEVQFNQLLMNLCINARDAMKGKGKLTIRLAHTVGEEAECIMTQQTVKGDWVELSVSDTGSGIEASVLERIFEPFFTTKDVGKGTGMGLSVIHGIMHSHGGHILVDTEVGKGSTFRLLFPPALEESAEISMLEESSNELPHGHGEQVMILDDEPDLAIFVGDLLESHGYQIKVLTNSKVALELFKENPDNFSMLITDQTMPGLTGMELVEAMRKIRPDFPVILNTGFSDAVDAETIARMDIHYFAKPVNSRSLVQKVGELLNQ